MKIKLPYFFRLWKYEKAKYQLFMALVFQGIEAEEYDELLKDLIKKLDIKYTDI